MKQISCIALALLISGASSELSAAVKVRYFKGQPTFVSAGNSSMVEIATPEEVRSRRVGFAVAAVNLGLKPESLGYENIALRTTAGLPVQLIPYETLQHQARVRAGWATFFTSLAVGLNTYAAYESAHGSVGRYRYYSPVAGQLALDRATVQNGDMLQAVTQQLDATLAGLDDSVLRTTTIDPHSSFGGFVVFDLPKGVAVKDLILTLTFSGDVHTVPLDTASPSLEQASAAEMHPESVADDLATAAPPRSVLPPRPTVAAKEPPKCGLVPQHDGSELIVPC